MAVRSKKKNEQGQYFYDNNQPAYRYEITSSSIEHPEMPEVKGTTRAALHLGGWILERIDESSTRAVYSSWSNPKGNIP